MNEIKQIVVVTSASDDASANEDFLLHKEFCAHIQTTIIRLDDLTITSICETCAYCFRCIYGKSGTVERPLLAIYNHMHKNEISYINVFNGKADQQGKSYLAKLYKSGFAVVPTFECLETALEYDTDVYVIKPRFGGSGKGHFVVNKTSLPMRFDKNIYVAQPLIHITSETSHFYVDNEYQYSLISDTHRWDLKLYKPQPEERALVERFVNWNPIKGIQRVDCVWTDRGPLLLELEDWCPFLSLFETAGIPLQKVVRNLLKSLGA